MEHILCKVDIYIKQVRYFERTRFRSPRYFSSANSEKTLPGALIKIGKIGDRKDTEDNQKKNARHFCRLADSENSVFKRVGRRTRTEDIFDVRLTCRSISASKLLDYRLLVIQPNILFRGRRQSKKKCLGSGNESAKLRTPLPPPCLAE